jgi:hypothetical protein
MRRLLFVLPALTMFVGFVLLFQQPAYAYADPGTGLLAIQTLGSALVATGWYLRRKIRTLFLRNATPKEDKGENPARDLGGGSSLS